jgi:hypothetical protein
MEGRPGGALLNDDALLNDYGETCNLYIGAGRVLGAAVNTGAKTKRLR